MVIKRRKLSGKPLLLATAATAITISGCAAGENSGPIASNPMAPPEYFEFCIEVDPKTAQVTLDGEPMVDGECKDSVIEGDHEIAATAEGYRDYSEQINLLGDTTHTIEMNEENDAGTTNNNSGE